MISKKNLFDKTCPSYPLFVFLGEEGFQEMKKELFRHGHELHYSVEEYFRDPGSEFRVSLKADGDPTVENLIHSLSPVIDEFQR